MRWTNLMLGLLACAAPGAALAQNEVSVERGRYLVMTTGCNDCHTAGYGPMEGNIPEEDWLKGDAVGWRGPWGTTYAVNLRIRLNEMSEDDWVAHAQTFKTRPPMPWFNVNVMTEADLRSLYQYITSFEELGEPAPEYLPPSEEPQGPVIQFPDMPPPQ